MSEYNASEYAGQASIADEPKQERCNALRCDHADDDELLTCESCHAKTCDAHAKHHAGFVLCKDCGRKEYAAIGAFIKAFMEMVFFQDDAGSIAERVRNLADALENWDAE